MLCVKVGKFRYGKDGSNMFCDMLVSIGSMGNPVCCDAVLFFFDDEDDDAVFLF